MDAAEKKRKRPDNVNREVFALIGDQDPQMLPQNEESKDEEVAPTKRQKLDRDVDKWVQQKFLNPARPDSFKLVHWVKEKECGEPYQFARFNRKQEVIEYTQ